MNDAWRRTGIGTMLAVGILLLPGCARTNALPLTPEAAARVGGEYRLGLGDKVRVNVYGEKELSGEFQISGAGTINMPLIGNVPAVNLTARELQDSLTKAYADGFLKSPRVVVEVYDFRPYYILGEVQRPGQYPAREGMMLEGAIATAGGYSYRANRNRVFLRRAGDAQEYEVDPTKPVNVSPGDVIRVGERYF